MKASFTENTYAPTSKNWLYLLLKTGVFSALLSVSSLQVVEARTGIGQAVSSVPSGFTTCPTITNSSITSVTICSGRPVDKLEVNTTALPPNEIEFVRFETMYANPYQGQNGEHLGEIVPSNGVAVQTNVDFPENTGTTDKVYYVYACLKPEPTDPACIPFALITVTVKANPIFSITATEATCNGGGTQKNGKVAISGYGPTDTYELVTNGVFTGVSQSIPSNGILLGDISRTGIAKTYSVRLYTVGGCYAEKSAVLTNALCDCPPSKCIPITIQKIKSGRTARL